MGLTKFQPINYQTVDYTDDPGGLEKFQESYDRAKNLAVEAMDKKKSEFMDDAIGRLETNMFAPEGAKMIVDDGKGGKKLNDGFYSVMSKTPEEAFRKAQKNAEAAGLGRHAVNRREFRTEWQEIQKAAVQRQYQKLSEYGAKNGTQALQNILNAEGGKFNAYYQRFTDPYIESLGLTLANKAAREKKTFGGYTTRMRDGIKVVSGQPLRNYLDAGTWGTDGDQVFEDPDGMEYFNSQFGRKIYIDNKSPFSNMTAGDKITAVTNPLHLLKTAMSQIENRQKKK